MATITELERIVAKISVELAESHKKTEVSLAESRREVAESQKKTEATVDRLANELAESQKKTDIALQKTEKLLNKTVAELRDIGKNMGGVNERLGEIVELVVLPGLQDKMNERGHNYTKSSPRVKFKKNKKTLAEIDLLLENGVEVMVVEAKTRFKLGEMNDFIKKLELLRKEEKITGMMGKTIYAAAAAIKFDLDALKTAKKNGIYLVEIDDTDKTDIKPLEREAGTW